MISVAAEILMAKRRSPPVFHIQNPKALKDNRCTKGEYQLAARSAKFVMAFSKLGLVPDCGGSWFLPRVAGRARAMGLALLGDSLSAEQAAQWGIIWQLVDDAELADTSLQLARHLAAQPTFGLGLIKKALLAAETNSLDAQLDLERDYQRLAGRSDDYREGVSAFLAKRPPQFSGK